MALVGFVLIQATTTSHRDQEIAGSIESQTYPRDQSVFSSWARTDSRPVVVRPHAPVDACSTMHDSVGSPADRRDSHGNTRTRYST